MRRITQVHCFVSGLTTVDQSNDQCVCGVEVQQDGRVLSNCDHKVHDRCLREYWILCPGFNNYKCPLCLRDYKAIIEQEDVPKLKVEQQLSAMQNEQPDPNVPIFKSLGTKRRDKDIVPDEDVATADPSADELTYNE